MHIFVLTGFRNRFFVVLSWAWSFITFRRGARLIVDKNWRFYGTPEKENFDPSQNSYDGRVKSHPARLKTRTVPLFSTGRVLSPSLRRFVDADFFKLRVTKLVVQPAVNGDRDILHRWVNRFEIRFVDVQILVV